jgi:hypothetical protein
MIIIKTILKIKKNKKIIKPIMIKINLNKIKANTNKIFIKVINKIKYHHKTYNINLITMKIT